MEEQLFNILTYLIILVAIFIAGRKVFNKIFKKGELSCENGCDGCSVKCELKEQIKVHQ